MVKFLDDFLNGITMYRLLLYLLIFLLIVALIFSLFGLLPFNPLNLILSASLLIMICYLLNKLLSKILKIPSNFESVFITALILSLIITPIRKLDDFPFLLLSAVFAISSKYLLTINKKHLFNPSALGVFISGIILARGASWWVGNFWMAFFVLISGILIVKKIKKFDLVLSFFLVYFLLIAGLSLLRGTDPAAILKNLILDSPVLFFAFIMLTEPQTSPSTQKNKIFFGSFTGLLLALSIQIGTIFLTPELALLLSNIFSYLLSPQKRLLLKLDRKNKIDTSIFEFIFNKKEDFLFTPGQYLEWTLPHNHPDQRGIRRFFTISSSPTEENISLGAKFYPNPSSFKKTLLELDPESPLFATGPMGEFILPKDKSTKLCFIAGGIGITPYRSMIMSLLDKNEKRTITLIYLSKSSEEFVYKDVFRKAKERLGAKIIYLLTDTENVPKKWQGRVGKLDMEIILRELPDYPERLFYISGPHLLVESVKSTLKDMGISGRRIKTDYFPGYTS